MNFLKISFLTFLGKSLMWFSRTFNFGHGSTWPGHLALRFYPGILSFYSQQLGQGIILIAGTNGKTTAVKMVRTVLEKKGMVVVHNESGANLLNGIVSAFLLNSDFLGRIRADYGVFEVDEATLPLVISSLCHAEFISASDNQKILKQVQNDNFKFIVVLLNLFRDQLDRYGEVDTIARKWQKALSRLSKENTVILNADDPQIATLGQGLKTKTLYFGIDDKSKYLAKKEHATDSVYCPNCGNKLTYEGVYYSHLGVWLCPKCGLRRPQPNLASWQQPISGLYNLYNTLAAVLTCQSLGITKQEINQALMGFQPAFGRQEEFKVSGKKVKIFLGKNPVSVNEAIRTIITSHCHPEFISGSNEYQDKMLKQVQHDSQKITVVLALNDNIPDGRDVSWIWDVEYEELISKCKTIICTGTRAYDLGLRIKYGSAKNYQIKESLEEAVKVGLENISDKETLFILPTYSAMLDIRKILSGKKIL